MKRKNEKYILKILFFFVILFSIGIIFRKTYYKEIINSEMINLVTYENDKQGYHPKVLYFNKGWNGYKYWMAFTPYKNANSDLENPCINASNNMIDWEVPKGLTNPLDIPVDVDEVHYNSDTHLLYNEDTNKLEIFWRLVNDKDNKVTIFKSESSDGSNWSDKEVFLYSDNRKKQDYVSPAIIYDNGIYRIWYVHRQQVWYMEKNLKTGEITKPYQLNINYDNGMRTWHMDIIYQEGKYEMVTVAYKDVNNRKEMPVYYTYSSDNKNWSTPKLIIKPSTIKNKFDSYGLYRASILKIDEKYYIFYSGHDRDYNVGIGLMTGTNIEKLKAYEVK